MLHIKNENKYADNTTYEYNKYGSNKSKTKNN